VRERRIERRAAAARAAISRGQLVEARDALAEIQELDPNSLEVAALSRAYDSAEFNRKTRRRHGPAILTAAVVIAGVLAATQLGKPDLRREPLGALQFAGFASPVSYDVTPLDPLPPAADDDVPDVPQAVATTLSASPVVEAPASRPAPSVIPPPASRPAEVAVAPVVAPIAVPAPPVVAAVAPVAEPAPAPTPVAETATVALTTESSERMIRQALERYRAAYERLDARSAQQVWPAVDESALARAFTGLKSQTLTFDDCEIHIVGPVATAACSGSMRYVPKVGSRDPRIESRLWDFTLRQVGSDWKIEVARVNR